MPLQYTENKTINCTLFQFQCRYVKRINPPAAKGREDYMKAICLSTSPSVRHAVHLSVHLFVSKAFLSAPYQRVSVHFDQMSTQ